MEIAAALGSASIERMVRRCRGATDANLGGRAPNACPLNEMSAQNCENSLGSAPPQHADVTGSPLAPFRYAVGGTVAGVAKWLLKSEPDEFGSDDLVRNTREAKGRS